ncbi:MAG: CBS domain-containing protein [Pseudomonadota bacterium]
MLVSQILKTKAHTGVITVPPTMTVSDAAKMLSEKRIGTLMVSRDGKKPEGIVSERDIVRELASRGTNCLSLLVSDLMTTKLVTTQRDDDAVAVLQKMTDGRFRHMPVVENGELIGLISLGDVVKARLMELAMEKTALEGMIMGH